MKNPLSFWRVTRYTLSAVAALALFIILKATLPASHAQPQPQPTPIAFETPVAYTTGRSPIDFTAGDFNGDGRLDLATVNVGDRTVSLLLNQGNGAFGAKNDFPSGADPVRLVAGDFNNDNKLDLVTVNFSANSFSLLLGNGNGGFAPKTDTATAAGPLGVATGDFNRDNRLDLIVGYAGQAMLNFVSYYPGNGNGTFGTRVDLTVGRIHESLAVADFNADNNPDIAVANINDNSISILLGNGNGAFAPKRDTALGFNPAALDVADNNGDGKLDLLVSHFSDNKLRILPGNGNGTFGTQVELIVPPPPTAAAQVAAKNKASTPLRPAVPNGALVQGKNLKCAMPQTEPPNLLATQGPHTFVIFQSKGQLSFFDPQYLTTAATTDSFGLHDVNGDGSCDIVSSDFDGNRLWVSLQKRPCPTIRITGILPEGVVGTKFFAILSADGGTAPYTLAVTSGNLPPGLSMDSLGIIVSTPTVAGVYTFTVTATDKNGCKGSQTFTVTVKTCPPITVKVFFNPEYLIGDRLVNGTIVEGGTRPYTYAITNGSLPPGLHLDDIGLIGGTFTTAGVFTFTLTVTDSKGCQGSQTFTIRVNCPPITINLIDLHDATLGVAYKLELSAAGGKSPYSFSVSGGPGLSGLSIDSLSIDTGKLSGTPVAIGPSNFTVTAKDMSGCTAMKTSSISINPFPAFATSVPQLPPSTLGQFYTHTFQIKDGTPPHTFNVTFGSGQLQSGTDRMRSRATAERALATAERALIDSLPPGITLNAATGTLSGTPTTPGTYNFTITATDRNSATVSRAFSLVVACAPVTLSPNTLPDGQVGTAYTQTLTATGGGTPSFAVSAGALPPGVTLNTATGALTGTLTQAGTFTFTIRATDSSGCSGTREYTLTITCPTVTLSPNTLPEGRTGTAYQQTLTASGAAGGTLSFAVSAGALPPGLTLNAATGVLSGTPAQTGTFTFTIRASTNGGCTGTREYTLTIACPTVTLSPNTLPNGTVGATYNQSLASSGGTAPYTFSLMEGALPAGLTLSAAGLLAGTPTRPGDFNFTVKATDASGCSASRAYTLNTACPAVTLTPNTLPDGRTGTAYQQTLTVSAAGLGTLSFAISTGALPPGLTLNATTGTLTGTPTQAGTFTFTIRAAASSGCSGTREYTLNILCPTLTLNPETLPNGTLSAAYNQLLATDGGTAPYSFSLSAGALPPGLTLSAAGALSGTATQLGASNFTIRAVDASNCAATRAYTLNIVCPTVALAPATLPNGKVGTAYTQTLTASAGGTLSFAVTAGALPAGLSLVASTGVLAGTPTVAGAFNFTVRATSSSTCSGTQAYTLTIAALPAVASVSAASFRAESFAPEMIVAAFGAGFTTVTQAATTLPLPVALAGVTLRVNDSAGAERLAQLFFISPQQINYLLPAGLAKGRAAVTVLNGNELVAAGTAQINDVAPGLFSANASGQGVPAAVAIKLRANGEQVFLPVAQFDAQQNRFVPVPLELGAADERLFLVLFGTGLRFRSALDKVTAKIGGVDAPVFFAGAQGQLDGLDQLNLEVSKALAGRGLVDVMLMVDGQTANTVQIQLK